MTVVETTIGRLRSTADRADASRGVARAPPPIGARLSEAESLGGIRPSVRNTRCGRVQRATTMASTRCSSPSQVRTPRAVTWAIGQLISGT